MFLIKGQVINICAFVVILGHVATVAEYHQLGGWKTTEIHVLQFLMLGSPRSRWWQIWCLVLTELVAFKPSFPCVLAWQKGQGAILGLFYKAPTPSLLGLCSPGHLPKALPPDMLTLGFVLSCMRSGEGGSLSLWQRDVWNYSALPLWLRSSHSPKEPSRCGCGCPIKLYLQKHQF